MKKYAISLLTSLLFWTGSATAQEFNDYFADETLRLDYIFSGTVQEQEIAVDELSRMPRWYGKRKRLADVPVEGNGEIIVSDRRTGTVIYKNSFSTLFQEWLSYDEASTTRRAFENVFLVPMPKDTADITVVLRNNRRETMVSSTHMVVPTDILIRKIGYEHVTPYETVWQAEDTTRCIHIAYIAEGYQENEMETFMKDVETAQEAMFTHEPFASKKGRFNVVAVKAPSVDSGTSEPRNGQWKRTALSSHFDTFYSDRYLTTLHLKDMHDWLAGTPYEHIIVLVNTEKYGGGGILNSYNLAMAHHRQFKPVVVHEFGHSFAGLGDEYAYDFEAIPMYPHDVEPWEPNLTTLVDFDHKWKDLTDGNTSIDKENGAASPAVGLYEGAGYSLKGVYRPSQDCRMRTNNHPEFCPVCQRSISRLIDFYTD
ncbi:MAG: peptidase M64 [Prevotella sp.]|nr:peptidase M64 [Prevotella sp.]